MKLRVALVLAALAVPGIAAAPAVAQTAPAKEPEILNNPLPEGFQVLGITPAPKPRKDPNVQEGKAMRIKATGSGDPWSIGINIPIQAPVKAGDKLVMLYWARVETPEEGKTTARISAAQIQLAAEPYTALFGAPAEVGPEWKLYEVRGKADKDYAARILGVSLHLNTGKHVIDIGPVAVLNYGQ